MNKFQLFLSLICGVIPYERLNLKANIFLSYVHMYVAPLLYLICFGMVRFGSLGVHNQSKCDSICRLGNSLFINLGFFLYISTHILTLWRRKQFFIDFKKSLEDIDEHIRHYDKVHTPKQQTKYKYYGTWFVVVTCFVATSIYDTTELLNYYSEYFFILLMASNFPYLACSIVLGQFAYFVSEISKRFSLVNEFFGRINHEIGEKYAPLIVFDIQAEAKKNLPVIKEVRHRHNIEFVTKSNEDSAEFYDSLGDQETLKQESSSVERILPKLFTLHDKLQALSVLTNAEFGPQTVPYLTVCFVLIIFGIFLQTKVFFAVGGKRPLLDYVIFLYSLWSLITMLVGYIVLRLCCIANGFSRQSAHIMHEIMHKKPAFMLANDICYKKMKSFTLQFLHWEGYFQFNGIGMFILDYTFIFSIISAATSYLIVLLQFDMTAIFNQEGLL